MTMLHNTQAQSFITDWCVKIKTVTEFKNSHKVEKLENWLWENENYAIFFKAKHTSVTFVDHKNYGFPVHVSKYASQ